jgi:energy-converting hydrogenase Eha subunit E
LNASNFLSLVALAQAFYFLLTGIWPLVSMATFEAVTGPKFDDWLVKTVGVLVSVIGVVLAIAALRRRITLEIFVGGRQRRRISRH